MSLTGRFADAMGRVLQGARPQRLCVAVSGGSDSMALLALSCAWAGEKTQIHAVTVDHGLRAASAEEAAFVAEEAARLGARHRILRWSGWSGRGNLQAEARKARQALLTAEAQRCDAAGILLGHTQDDQAETVLMRLLRGSGVDGLAAMAEGRLGQSVFLRPLLAEARAELRAYLEGAAIGWIDDPSNDDTRFERVQVRQAMTALGLEPDRLAATATAMARAREALELRARDVARRVVADHNGIIAFDAPALAATEAETRLRLVAHALQCLSGHPYRPRLQALTATLGTTLAGTPATLHGCHLLPKGDRLFVLREAQAVKNTSVPADGSLWDGRWKIRAGEGRIAALGEAGLRQWHGADGLPRAAFLSYPGLWRGSELLAVPGFFNSEDLDATYLTSASFHATLLSH